MLSLTADCLHSKIRRLEVAETALSSRWQLSLVDLIRESANWLGTLRIWLATFFSHGLEHRCAFGDVWYHHRVRMSPKVVLLTSKYSPNGDEPGMMR